MPNGWPKYSMWDEVLFLRNWKITKWIVFDISLAGKSNCYSCIADATKYLYRVEYNTIWDSMALVEDAMHNDKELVKANHIRVLQKEIDDIKKL